MRDENNEEEGEKRSSQKQHGFLEAKSSQKGNIYVRWQKNSEILKEILTKVR